MFFCRRPFQPAVFLATASGVSGGISIETGTADFDGIYRRADEALYRAKAEGKNRSVVYQAC